MMDPIDAARCTEILHRCKISAQCLRVRRYRHFAYFDLEINPGCKINQIKNAGPELALAMRSSTIPILKNLSQEGIVRLQITESKADMLYLTDFLARSVRPSGILPFLLGETDEGEPLWVEMSANPHLLVAGATGSGKTVLLHNLLLNSFQFHNVQLHLVDTKLVEFGPYRNHPQVISLSENLTEATGTLQLLIQVMDSRYQRLKSLGKTKTEEAPHLFPPIIFMIDEAADLFLSDPSRQFEQNLIRLAAKSRAAGIYVVLATQRPSAEVLNPLVKANFPARLACKTASRSNSQVILDQPGAENLAGCGDALILTPQLSLTRFQIAYTSHSHNLRG